jgi:hypothetical protein
MFENSNEKNAERHAATPVNERRKADRVSGMFPQDLRSFLDRERWTFAKTMPIWPHEYLVRERVDEALFERTVVHIRSNGYEDRFYARPITYFEENGLVYWTMAAPVEETVIINRCRKEDSFEYRFLHGTLPR